MATEPPSLQRLRSSLADLARTHAGGLTATTWQPAEAALASSGSEVGLGGLSFSRISAAASPLQAASSPARGRNIGLANRGVPEAFSATELDASFQAVRTASTPATSSRAWAVPQASNFERAAQKYSELAAERDLEPAASGLMQASEDTPRVFQTHTQLLRKQLRDDQESLEDLERRLLRRAARASQDLSWTTSGSHTAASHCVQHDPGLEPNLSRNFLTTTTLADTSGLSSSHDGVQLTAYSEPLAYSSGLAEAPAMSSTRISTPPLQQLPGEHRVLLAERSEASKGAELKLLKDEHSWLRDQQAETAKQLEVARRELQKQQTNAAQRLDEARQEQLRQHAEDSKTVEGAKRAKRDVEAKCANLEAELSQAQMQAQDQVARLEKLVTEQRLEITRLEESAKRFAEDCSDATQRSQDLGEALYVCLQERNSLMRFVVDLLEDVHTLLMQPRRSHNDSGGVATHEVAAARAYDHFGDVRGRSLVSHGYYDASSEVGGRAVSVGASRPRTGCYACAVKAQQRTSSPFRAGSRYTHTCQDDARQQMTQMAGPTADLQELAAELGRELAESSARSRDQLNRISLEVERSDRLTPAVHRGIHGPGPTCGGDTKAATLVLRTCSAWVLEDRRRREAKGLPAAGLAPVIDWSDERCEHRASTKAMQTQLERLAKVHGMLRPRR
eukprot:TRINITY_DN28549_c0_g1_i1.p1 TRINITY_DN28549_c0_g1~~TRINITY_DN28549_c0_g1_i1.p1  ORF type:complete len:676 (-),score=171.65 TRINITY_DN28549_c0_g1_i1:109-2136(-)